MIYKIYSYIDGKCEKTSTTEDYLFDILDELILKQNVMNIIVVEYDAENNLDSPYYIYTGNRLEYSMFKEIKKDSYKRGIYKK